MVDFSQSWISENTWLSDREAEFFLLYYDNSNTIKSAASKMDIKETSAASHKERIEEKVGKSENTLELFNKVVN